MTADATPVDAEVIDNPIYSVNVASEILESNPGTLLVYEDLGIATPRGSSRRRYSTRDMLG